jgi:beta-glucuronidase
MRETKSLNGLWYFLLDTGDSGDWWGEYFKRQTENPRFSFISGFEKLAWRGMQVPGCWNVEDPELKLYEGVAWYAREFDVPVEWAGQQIHLRFEAVNERARIWLNDQEVGAHDGGYTPFEFVVTPMVKGKGNYLVAKVDNRRLPDCTVPSPPYDNYGGIFRGVSLFPTGSAKLAWLAVLPELRDSLKEARLTVRYEVTNLQDQEGQIEAVIRIADPAGGVVHEAVRQVRADGRQTVPDQFEVAVAAPMLWGPGHPHLYRMEVQLRVAGEQVDEVARRFGIREVTVRDGRILLNGEPVFLKGVGRHDEYPGLGRTLDEELWQKDFDLVQGLNANAVRLVHYPHDEREIEMADERGLLLWEEVPLIFFPDFTNPAVTRRVCGQLEELIRRDINHPSVIIWSVGNEIQSDTPAVAACLKTGIELARKLDPTRLVSFASWPLDLEKNTPLAFVDVIAFNRYRGWYDPDIPGITEEILAYRAKYPEKAILVSEFGAGAVRGYHAESGERWSEEYQARVIQENIECMLKSGQLSGCFIWCLADFGGLIPNNIYERGYNVKGLVDGYRMPKQAYWAVREIFGKIR